MHAGYRRDPEFRADAAHLHARAAVAARGKGRARDHHVRPLRPHPAAHRLFRGTGLLVEVVVATHHGRDDRAVRTEQRLDGPAGADRSLLHSRGRVGPLLAADPGEELVQVMSDTQRPPVHRQLLSVRHHRRARSATWFSASTVRAMAAPGTIPYQGAAYRYSRLSLIIRPHDACGGCVPRPRKLRLASSRMARATPIGICTNTGERMLGRIVRKTMRASRAPDATEASTYSIRRWVNTPARAMRATRAIARSTAGIASSVSTARMTAASATPPRKPVHRPSGTPHNAAIAVAPMPTANAIRPPYSTRLKISRPNWSVPRRCSQDGKASTAFLFIAVVS